MGIGLGWLALVQSLTTRHTLILVNRVNSALGLDPVMEGGTPTRYLEDIEGLPAIGLVVTGVAFHGLAHHAEEEIHNGTAMAG